MIDERLDREIEVGAKAKPRYSTDIITTDGGFEFRNSRWAYPLFSFEIDLEPGAPAFDEDLQACIDLFHAAGGTADTFRFRHWRDYQALHDPIASGDGSTTQFQLYRIYARGAVTRRRKITRPIDGTVEIQVDGVVAASTVDAATGIVTLSSAPANGALITASFEFDVPVRFADDTLEIASLSDDLDQIGTITLQEVREYTSTTSDGGTVTPSNALVSIDFKHGVYTIGGTSKTLAECCETNVNYGTFDPANVVNGTGWTLNNSTAGLFNKTDYLALTSGAFAAAVPGTTDNGFTAVMTFNLALSGDGFVDLGVEFIDDAYSTDWGFQAILNAVTGPPITDNSSLFDFDAINDDVPIGGIGVHTIAFTFSADHLAASVDGGVVVTTGIPMANAPTIIGMYLFAQTEAGSAGPAIATIEKIQFVTKVADASLPGLSGA